jgi:hypothetical protein
MPDYKRLLYDIEVHSVEGIQEYFRSGGSPNEKHDGVPLFTTMVEMYTRGPRFKDCVQSFIDAELKFDEAGLLAVLTHDPKKLEAEIRRDPTIVSKPYFLFRNTYTPLTGGTLMHYCAEFNSVDCAQVLLRHHADVNAPAAIDENGFGGHTPIFHTVNQNGNHSKSMLELLVHESADVLFPVRGLIWGKGYEWETFIPAVNPISYAKMGLLPQMHRNEKTISEVIKTLMKQGYGIDYVAENIPNRYLSK